MARNKKQEIKEWTHAVCPLSMVAVRSRPHVFSDILSQMLFGECCIILEKKNKNWHKVKTDQCQTIGWVSTHQLLYIPEKIYNDMRSNVALSLEVSYQIFNDENSIHIVLGSSLPSYDGISCNMPYSKYIFNGQAIQKGGMEITPELFVKIARRYLYSPELLNGRSPFGIDNILFIHQVFRLFYIDVTKNVHQQIQQGELVDFVQQACVGDIAFFQDNEGQTCHAGIVLGPREIIHVHGFVRVDKLDQHGIYHKDLKKYTHKLRVIKRIPELQQLFLSARHAPM
jgi:hypothetical protein